MKNITSIAKTPRTPRKTMGSQRIIKNTITAETLFLGLRIFITSACLWGACLSPGFAADSTWRPVEKVFGRPGIEQGGLFKVVFPRADLNVLVEGIPLEPAMGLTTWFAFSPYDRKTLVMGELVLLDREVSDVLNLLVQSGFKVTALHNLVLGESPGIQCVQITGQGYAGDLARKLKQVLRQTGTPLTPALLAPPGTAATGVVQTHSMATPPVTPVSRGDTTPANNPVDGWDLIRAVLGEGQVQGKILEYCYPRNKSVQENGMEIPPLLGTSTCFCFQKSGDKVAVIGTFVLYADEVNLAVETLTRYQLKVTSINNHMLDETPRLIFLHFWGVGKPGKIAGGLKTTLNQAR
jgi:hypothetical protein